MTIEEMIKQVWPKCHQPGARTTLVRTDAFFSVRVALDLTAIFVLRTHADKSVRARMKSQYSKSQQPARRENFSRLRLIYKKRFSKPYLGTAVVAVVAGRELKYVMKSL